MNLNQVQAVLAEMSKSLGLYVNAYSIDGSAVLLAHGMRKTVSNINVLVNWHGATVLQKAGLEMTYNTDLCAMVSEYGCITFKLDAAAVQNAVCMPGYSAGCTALEALLATKQDSPLKKDREDTEKLRTHLFSAV